MIKIRFIGVMLILFIMLPCGCVSFKFASTGSEYKRSNRTADEVELLYGSKVPERPYIAVGYVATQDVWFVSSARCKTELKRKAAALGLDGVYQIYIGVSGNNTDGAHTGKGFVYQR
ncbi:MAG: hypothetical protein MUD12_10355 [Spirochaetes bacterium]|nr:hypothetical protein [Spirochaetota bacterium]